MKSGLAEERPKACYTDMAMRLLGVEDPKLLERLAG